MVRGPSWRGRGDRSPGDGRRVSARKEVLTPMGRERVLMLMKRRARDSEAFVLGRTLLNLVEPVILHDVFLLPTFIAILPPSPSSFPFLLSSTSDLSSVVVLWVSRAF